MKGKEYLNFLEKWEIINDLPLDLAIERFEPEILEEFLDEWLKLHRGSLKNDDIWSNSAGLPIIPTSGTSQTSTDLIANIALYTDRQIIHDPIDRALKNTGTNPIQHMPRFVAFLKRDLKMIIELQPLIRENIIELMPYQYIASNFSANLRDQLNKDWFENRSLKYIEERIKWKVYLESNLLAFHIGDLDILPVERYGIIDGDSMKETENSLIVKFMIPPNLENVDKDTIRIWVHDQFHKYSSRVANNINEKILLAELFSGSIATSEMLSHEFIKRKNANAAQEVKDSMISIHYIPILGEIDLEKFIDLRSKELPSFISFREEWDEGRGLFKGDISSKDWIDNLDLELNKCKKELDKSKKIIYKKIVETTAWTGLGIGVGVLAGSLVGAAVLAGMIPFAKDIKRAWVNYLQERSSIETSTPFFLLNIIDRKTNEIRTDVPPDLPKKMAISKGAIEASLPMLGGAPITLPYYPQGKINRKESSENKKQEKSL